ncbi:tail fiber assembly protein [Escherichia coli]|uniref:tail fiber assembly protein n=1 Tax=Escherichia coli TaxID=562 RepID=UPI000BDE9AB7|nr:tail fiber assembly protein [Escherichia coli]EFE7707510.1 tail fiber assembly protein [Escherichia coli]EKK2494333.1 tail fiber assembly protein [Escherichia coli]MDZ9594212.1 tail fiber assembly protein [Escherichia coli]BEB72744.1 hypothetical protein VEE18_28310 [Escherichia coli]HAW8046119.1 tail fiber assembly protein [Escherichia coli]
MYKYSAKNNAFYLAGNEAVYRDSGTWPDDATEIETQLAESFMVTPPQGKRRIAGADGMPDWGDIPPPTQEEVIASVSAKKQALISEANNLIAPLKDASDGGYIDDADKPVLVAWQKYRYDLTKVDPTKPVWPKKPGTE